MTAQLVAAIDGRARSRDEVQDAIAAFERLGERFGVDVLAGHEPGIDRVAVILQGMPLEPPGYLDALYEVARTHAVGLMPQHDASVVYVPNDAASVWEAGPGLEDVRIEPIDRLALERAVLGT
jgi:hypothetical protein